LSSATPGEGRLLLRHLERAHPRVRHKILRGLGRMRADDPELRLPTDCIEREAGASLDRAIELLAYRIACYVWSVAHEAPGHAGRLLGEILGDEESRAMEQVFRALHILDPEAGFGAIFEALREEGAAHAEGLELIEHLVGDDLRATLLAMAGQTSDLEKLQKATRDHGSSEARALADALAAEGKAEPPEGDDSGAPEAGPLEPAVKQALDAIVEKLLAEPDPALSELARYRFVASPRSPSPTPARETP
jgi:hypothetical protein